MILTERFKSNPPDEIVKEFPLGSNVKFIPIRHIKRMLNEDFYKWGTSNFKCEVLLRGNDIIVISSVELNLELMTFPSPYDTNGEINTYTFVGSNTFNTKTEQPEGNGNENWSATALSNCIKNASKNCGVKYGSLLNTDESYLPNYNEGNSDVPTPKDNIGITIKKIIKEQKNKTWKQIPTNKK